MKKLGAFTLMELLIAMIVSSIVIAFGYSVYSIIYKQYLTYKTSKTEIVSTMQFNTTMNNDFINSVEITFAENTVTIFNKNKEPLHYKFNDDNILRMNNEVTDTFKLAAVNMKEKFVLRSEDLHSSLINEISFDSQLAGDTQHFVFRKNYSAATLLNKEIKALRLE